MKQGKSIAIALARQPGAPPHLHMELWYKEEGGKRPLRGVGSGLSVDQMRRKQAPFCT